MSSLSCWIHSYRRHRGEAYTISTQNRHTSQQTASSSTNTVITLAAPYVLRSTHQKLIRTSVTHTHTSTRNMNFYQAHYAVIQRFVCIQQNYICGQTTLEFRWSSGVAYCTKMQTYEHLILPKTTSFPMVCVDAASMLLPSSHLEHRLFINRCNLLITMFRIYHMLKKFNIRIIYSLWLVSSEET